MTRKSGGPYGRERRAPPPRAGPGSGGNPRRSGSPACAARGPSFINPEPGVFRRVTEAGGWKITLGTCGNWHREFGDGGVSWELRTESRHPGGRSVHAPCWASPLPARCPRHRPESCPRVRKQVSLRARAKQCPLRSNTGHLAQRLRAPGCSEHLQLEPTLRSSFIPQPRGVHVKHTEFQMQPRGPEP